MKPVTPWLYVLALAIGLAGWPATAAAQERPPSIRPLLSTTDGRVQIFPTQMPSLTTPTRRGGGEPTLSVDGFTSHAGYGSGAPLNTTLLLPIGAGNALVGIGWEVHLTVHDPNWLADAAVAIAPNPGSDAGYFLTPAAGVNTAGSGNFSSEGLVMFEDIGVAPVPASAAGTLYMEFYTAFTSPDSQPIEWMDSTAPEVLPPGLRLICTDQAACDAAVADAGGGGDDAPVVKLTATDGAAGDWFGRAVAIDGTTALVGADAADVGGTNNRGAAYVFERVGDAWVQQARLAASDGAAFHQFGISVALSGDIALVGTGSAEAAYVFRRSGGTWVEEAKLTASDGASDDRFGIAVALDGETALVGAREADVAGRMNQGAAYVFVRQGDAWVQQAKLTAGNGQAFDLFGDAVAISGETAVVGAASADPGGHDSQGTAHVFVRQGGGWVEQAVLTANDGAAGHRFGAAVAVAGDLAVVGAPPAGAAYAFARTGTSWGQQARLTAPGAAAAWFGNAVAAHGETALVGALFADEAFLFRREDGVWTEGHRLTADDSAAGDQFGNAVALTGQRAVVGAWQASVGGASAQGTAYVFALDGQGGGEDPPPADDVLAFDPEVLTEALMAGEVGTETVSVINTSDEAVDFTFIQYADGWARPAPAVHRALDLPKGVPDPRPAMAPARGMGGPDGFGYAWIDSNEPGGPAYDWVDISATGTVVPLHDDGDQTVSLPFPFEFYGQEYTSIRIIANGWLGFDGTAIAYLNQPIPTPDEPNNVIAPFWDDLNPSEGGTILYQDMGDGRFVVSWIGVPHHPDDGAATFQAILYRHGAIKFQYQSIDFPVEGLESATIGIENADGTDGVQVVFNAPYVEDELAVLIQARPPFVTGVSPVSGTIPAGGAVNVDVTFDATALIGGTYEGRLVVEAGGGTYDLPVVLEVTGEPCLALDPAALDFGPVLVNASATLETTATNCGTDVTTISAVSVDHGDYTVEVEGGLPIALAPGASTAVAVTFTPTSEGTIEGLLSVSSDAPGSPHTVALTGIGAPPPDFSVEPTALTFNVDAAEISEPQTVTLINGGDGEGTFAIVTALGRQVRVPVAEARTSVGAPTPLMARDRSAPEPAAPTLRERVAQAAVATQQRAFAVRADEPSAGPAPTVAWSPLALPLNLRGGESSIAFGHNSASGDFGSFDFLTPGVFNPISSLPANVLIAAGALGTDPEVAYQVDGSVLYRVDTATGEATEVGDLGVELSGMTYDPTRRAFYGVPFVPAPEPTPLYVVDVETATLTLVGLGDYSTAIALAATPTGALYTYTVNTDVLVQLDKATGEGTVIGPIGFDANFAQGMTYDYVNDVMYMAAFNVGDFQPQLRAVDLETGATTLVGVLGVSQMGWVGAPAMGPRFLVVTPQEGTVPAHGQTELQVRIDATELNGGTYEADIVIVTNDPLAPEFVVDVTINVTGAPGILIEPGALAFGDVIVGTEAPQALTITNTGTDVLSISGISTDDSVFTTDFSGSLELGVGESETVVVTFAPEAPGAYTGTLTVTSNAAGSPDAVTLMGTGVAAPVAGVDQDEVGIQVEPGATGTATLTLSNLGGDDAADLTFEASVVAARPGQARLVQPDQARATATRGAALAGTPLVLRGENATVARADGSTAAAPYVAYTGGPRTYLRGGNDAMITHSVSQEITPGVGVACGNAFGGYTTENSFWRVFDLAEVEEISGSFSVTAVEVGVETADGPALGTTVRLYTLDGAFVTSNLTLVGEASSTIPSGTALQTVTIPVEGEFAADDVLVVEWFVEHGETTTSAVYPGANSAGETGPSYISSASCEILEPTTYADIGFPEVHLVMNVYGQAGPALLSVSPESGAVAPGQSQELTLTVDASGVEPGEYAFEVVVATNDPANPTLTVPVTVTVGLIDATEDGAVPTAFALAQNYPNPFASHTVIEYALPEATHVTLAVYDAVGRLVATLVDAERPAGYHEVEWQAAGLSSGVYFYRIEARAYQRTQKMVLVQ